MVGMGVARQHLEALAGESGVAKRQGLRAALFGGCPLQREDPKPVGLRALRAARAKPLSLGFVLSLFPFTDIAVLQSRYLAKTEISNTG
jgi:hypothetical protein